MQPIVMDRVAWSVCRSVCHDREPCKTGWTDRDAVWLWTRVGPKKHVLDGGPDPNTWMGNFEGESGRPMTCPDTSGGRYTQSDSTGGSTGTVQMLIGVY